MMMNGDNLNQRLWKVTAILPNDEEWQLYTAIIKGDDYNNQEV